MSIVCGKEVELPDPKDDVAVIKYVKNHLLSQGKKSLDRQGSECRYRSPDETCACAIGCLIPDDKYVSYIEGCGLGHEDVSPFIMDYEEDTLRCLQYIHDSTEVEEWKKQLDDLIVINGGTI